MKTIKTILILFLLLSFSNTIYSQSKNKSSNTTQNKNNTYEVNGTKYIQGETYKTTGQPKVQRNSSAKKQFLKENGYTKEPKGYEVDHVKPLSQGGSDTPNNMQLLTKEQHKQKTTNERKQINSTYTKSTLNKKTSNSTSKNQHYKNSSTKSTNFKSTNTRKKKSK